MTRLLAATAVAVLLTAVGCSSDDDGSATSISTPPATSAAPVLTDCGLLSSDEITRLAGEPLGDPKSSDLAGLSTCNWNSPDGSHVQLIDVPAGDWADQIPSMVVQLENAGLLNDGVLGPRLREARDLIEAGATIGADEACSLFSSLLELQGEPHGSFRTVAVLPTPDDPQGISAQYCASGRYTAVLLEASDLTGSRAEAKRVVQAVGAARG